MPAPSLLDLSRRACIKNINHLEDVGDIHYQLIRPVLLKLENPEQLRRIEDASPQLLGQDGEIWLNFIKRDIPKWEKRPHEPKDPAKWWKVYRKLQDEVAEELRESEKKLQEALTKHQEAKDESRSTFIPKALDPGRTGRATNLLRWDGDRSSLEFQNGRVVGTKGELSGWGRSTAPKPKMTALEKMRKQGKESASNRMATPTHLLGNRTSRVTQVPKGMITPSKPALASTIGHSALQPNRRISPPTKMAPPVKIFAPGRASKSLKQLDHEVTKERERRLRAPQIGRIPGYQNSTVEVAPAPAKAISPPVKAISPGPMHTEKEHSPQKSISAGSSPAPFVRKRKVESVFMTTKKRKT